MNVIFMGTPDFAVASLKKLIDEKYNIIGVFTQPDKPKGRGHKFQTSPIKDIALENNIKVYQPVTLRDSEIQNTIKSLEPDMIIVVAYGKILPKAVLEVPKYGCINVHGSLLPKLRGAAPIQWSVLNGDSVTGVTTMFMAEGLDTGDMLLKKEVEIGADETSGELFDRLKDVGADLLAETIPLVVAGKITPEKQDDSLSTYAKIITKDMAEIDWSKPAFEIHNLVRGLNPWPCAVTTFNGKKMKVLATEVIDVVGEAGAASVVNGEFCVSCGEKSVILKEIQPENGKRMAGKSFLLGHPIDSSTVMGK